MTFRYKLSWFACLLLAVAGYSLVYRPYESAITDAFASRESIAFAIDQNRTLLARRTALENLRDNLERLLEELDLHDDAQTLVARYVRDAARLSSAHHVRITALQPLVTPHTPETQTALAAGPAALAATPLDLTLEGTYGDLLATIRGLSQDRILASVDLESLERSNTPVTVTTPHLDARLHIELKRTFAPGGDHVRLRST